MHGAAVEPTSLEVLLFGVTWRPEHPVGQQSGFQRPLDYGEDRWPVRGVPGGWVDGFDDGEVGAQIARIRPPHADITAQAVAQRLPPASTTPSSPTVTT